MAEKNKWRKWFGKIPYVYKKYMIGKNLCECNCGKLVIARFFKGHNRKGKFISEETRGKMSFSAKHRIINKVANFCQCGCGQECKNQYVYEHNSIGKKHSIEHNLKIGRAATGRICSEETRKKISRGNTGKKYTEETKKRMSEKRKKFLLLHPEIIEELRQKMFGKQYAKGYKQSEETKRKMSIIKSNMTEETKEKIRKYHLGKKASLESIIKRMRHGGHKKFLYDGSKGKIKMRSTWEVIYANYLDSKNYIWKYEPRGFRLSTGALYFPDFFIETLNEWHEVKGFMYKLTQEKIKLFQIDFPGFKFVLVDRSKFIDLGIIV